MADLQIEAERHQRHREAERGRQEALERGGVFRGGFFRVLLGGDQDAAFDLGAGGAGLRFGQRARRPLALQFAELIAIDREVVVEPRRAVDAPAQQRDQQDAPRRGGEEGEEEFEHGRLRILRGDSSACTRMRLIAQDDS